MTHTILITAYRNLEQLERLVDFFTEDAFRIYIHLDKKGNYDSKVYQRIKDKPQVNLLSQKYKVNWGGVNHLKAYLFLAREALKEDNSSYYHLITGQDLPVVSKETFLRFFQEQPNGMDQDYIRFKSLPNLDWHNGGMDRLKYFHLYDALDAKKHKRFIRKLVRLQKKLGLQRPPIRGFATLYGGSTYWSLTRESLSYVIKYTQEHPKFLKRCAFSFCAEELYFQTILYNSPLKHKLVNDNLRYIDWSKGRGSTPVVLDMRDYENLKASERILFARKFDVVSRDLMVKIKEEFW